ncbi:hypothetical protein OROMI_021748 [Orobanche minor]
MANKHLFFLIATVYWATVSLHAWVVTGELEVQALQGKLHGLGLTGNLGVELSNLKSLKHLTLVQITLRAHSPYSLPPNLTNLNLAENKLGQSMTYSFERMKHLRHLNLSHNFLTGPLDDVLNGLENLKLMDLSFNSFTGEFPTSFEYLTNLTGLIISLLDQ